MTKTEMFSYYEHEIREYYQSDYAIDYTYSKTIAVRCPRCSAHNKPLAHLEKRKCNKCGFRMARAGNGLFVSNSIYPWWNPFSDYSRMHVAVLRQTSSKTEET